MSEILTPGEERRHLPRTPSAEFTFQRFGRQTYLREDRVTVGTEITQILGNNPDRMFYMISNRSGSVGSIGWSAELTSVNGLFIAANGGFLSQDIQQDGDVVAWAVFGVSGAAGAIWYVAEILGTRSL